MYISLLPILQKLYPKKSSDAIEEIIQFYGEKGYAIVDFLYFANIIFNRLAYQEKNEEQALYQKAIEVSDFLLPDGIALKLLTQRYLGTKLQNLNGTDFLPSFLRNITSRYNTRIFLYGGTSEVVKKAGEYISQNFNVELISMQDGFGEYDWNTIESTTKANCNAINIILVGRGTPRQEIWMEKHRTLLKQYNCIAFAVGGLFDFWAGTEDRAPEWVRYIRCEWLYRVISDPKKNLKKTLASFLLFWYLLK